jgi:hypothetical protein
MWGTKQSFCFVDSFRGLPGLNFQEHVMADSGEGEKRRYYWEESPSIYVHISGHVQPGQTGLRAGGEALPDDARVAAASSLPWAPGAKDGVVTHHVGATDSVERDAVANAALDLVVRFCDDPTPENRQKVHEYVCDKQVIDFIDLFMLGLVKDRQPDPAMVYELARSLAIDSPDREPVKLGVALLGVFQGFAEQSVFKTLGRHDEFTLFCVVALKSTLEHPDEDIWELARNVTGWGRVAAVERLSGTAHAQIREWMLREGFRNTVMNEYLAFTCAVTGGLRAAIGRERLDDEFVDATGEILTALLNKNGPAQDINDYDDAAQVVESYVKHMASRRATPERIAALKGVRVWLDQPDQDWDTQDQVERRRGSLAMCDGVLKRWGDCGGPQ